MSKHRETRERIARTVGIGLVVTLLIVFMWYVEREGERITDHFTSSVRHGPSRMWLETPEVAPGGTIHLRVVTAGGVKSRIVHVRATAGADVATASGAEPWGDEIQTDSHSDNDDEVEVDVHAPDDAPPSRSLMVTAEVDAEIAADAAPANFRNEAHHDVLQARVEVVASGALAMHLVWRGCSALVVLAVVSLVAWIAGRRFRGEFRGDLAVLALMSAVGMAFLAGVAFVRPFERATRLYGEATTVIFTAIWVGLPVLAFALARRRTAATLPTARVR